MLKKELEKELNRTKLILDYAREEIKGKDKEIERLQNQLQQKENIIKDIKSQLDYLETYSSKEDVFEDMKRRLDRIESIVNRK